MTRAIYNMAPGELARDYVAAALCGTWAKVARSSYQRATGEKVAKEGRAWRVTLASGERAACYGSLYAAMWNADAAYRKASP